VGRLTDSFGFFRGETKEQAQMRRALRKAHRPPLEHTIEERQSADGYEFVCGRFRDPGAFFGASLMAAFLGALTAAVYLDHRSNAWMVLGAITLILLFLALRAALHSSILRIGPTIVTIQEELIFTLEKQVPRSEVASIELGVGSWNRRKRTYVLKLVTKSGKRITFANNIRNVAETDYLRTRIEHLLGL